VAYDIPSFETVRSTPPLRGALPGARLPYALEHGDGHRYDLGRALVTVIARPEDTGGAFWAAWVLGGRDVATPGISHADPQFLYVTEGRLQLRLAGSTRVLVPGDSATIPAGSPAALRLLSHRTRFLAVLGGASTFGLVPALGLATERRMYDLHAADVSAARASELAARFGIAVHDLPVAGAAADAPSSLAAAPSSLATALPPRAEPYVLEAGKGEHLESLDQLNTFLARARHTGGSFFALHTSGGRSPYIPRHVHRLHTENFLCLQGRILLHAGGQEIALHPGDFLHAPAGTIHSFSFAAHHTQMLGILTTDVFEPFFDRMNRPTDAPVHQEIGDRAFPAEAFGRVQAELDVEVVGPPPGA